MKPWATFYGGIVVLDPDAAGSEAIVTALLYRISADFGSIQLVHGPGFNFTAPFQKAGFAISTRTTLLFHAGSEEAMWARISSRARCAVRRAVRTGSRVQEGRETGILTRLYWETNARRQIRIHFRPEQFETICTGLLQSGRASIWTSFDSQGHPCSSVLAGWDDKRAYFLLAGSDSRYSHNGSGSLLYWEVLKALSQRFRVIDLVGDEDPGVRLFKMQFCPTVAQFLETYGYSGPGARMHASILAAARSVRQRLSGLRAVCNCT